MGVCALANETARTLRKNLTDAERHLWRHLREQTPIGAYIVDSAAIPRDS